MRFAVLALFLFTAPAQAQTALSFQNIPSEVQNEVLKEFPRLKIDRLSASEIDEILRFIGSKGTLENVRAERNSRGEVLIAADLKRVIGKIEFTGNYNIPTYRLEEVMKVKSEERFDRKSAIESGENLKELYGEAGFFNTVVELNFDQEADGSMNIQFSITENQPCQIQAIQLTSVNKNIEERLNFQMRRYRGENLTQPTLDKIIRDIQTFLSNRHYMTATIKDPKIDYNDDKTQAILALDIHDPIRWEFNISGNVERNHSELYKILDLTDRERRNIDPVAEAIDRLRRYYLEEGFPHVTIDGQIIKNIQPFATRVYLNVKEGPQVQIKEYKIEGRISRPESYYIDFIEDYSSSKIHRGVYNREDIDNGLENLINHLKNQGFLRARVQSLRAEYSKDLRFVTVYINMDEGSLTQIRSIAFDGNSFFPERELTSVFGLSARSPLKLVQLEEGIEKIKEFYRRQGFLEMRILNEDETLVSYNAKGTLAEVNFKIYEGPRVRVAEVVVDGNTFTKGYVIRREAGLRVGQILNPELIEEATDRLNRLGIFSRVDIRTLEEGTAIADRTLIISISERDPGIFRIGAGVNSERDLTARGFLGIGYNNLGGTARAISARAELNYNIAQINYPEHELTFGYLEPFLMNSRYRGRVNLTRSERVFAFDSERQGLTSLTLSERADVLIERQFTKTFRASWRLWGIDRRKDFEAQGRCLEDPNLDGAPNPNARCPSSTQQIGKIGPILDLDLRDSPFLPTKGSFSRALIEYSAPPLGSSQGIHFWKADAQYSKYIRLGSPKLIWANSIRGGYLQNLDGSPGSGIPANQAFFLGGIFTVRGFDSANNRERIPPEWELPVPRSTSIVITDYSYYGLIKSELRFPISGDHGGVIFYDGGLVQVEGDIRGEPVDITRPYRDSVGFGYRYNTPVGPVSLDFAFKTHARSRVVDPSTGRREKEDAFRVHFSIGTF